jgi:uncharacterized protein YjbI with pentapeptide repeats
MKKLNSFFVASVLLTGLLITPLHAFDPVHLERLIKTRNCTKCDLSNANLTRQDFSWADLSGTNLTGTDLSATTLYDANLRGANLTGAKITDTNFVGSDLSDAVWVDGKKCKSGSTGNCK